MHAETSVFAGGPSHEASARLERLFTDPDERAAVLLVFLELRSDQRELLLANDDETLRATLVLLENKQSAAETGAAQNSSTSCALNKRATMGALGEVETCHPCLPHTGANVPMSETSQPDTPCARTSEP